MAGNHASLNEQDVDTRRRRTLAIRHVSGDRVVAYLEILSPGNKSSRAALDCFLDKAVAVLSHGCHLLLVDLFPPGTFDPLGMHQAIWSQFCRSDWRQPEDKPLTLAAYTGGMLPEAYVEPVAIRSVLPDMPLFLQEDWYVNVPLEATYQEAYAAMPGRWREVIERPEEPRPSGDGFPFFAPVQATRAPPSRTVCGIRGCLHGPSASFLKRSGLTIRWSSDKPCSSRSNQCSEPLPCKANLIIADTSVPTTRIEESPDV
jgi:hypothetical protein